MQRLGNLNNKLIVESIYEPDNKNVIWKDQAEDKFKEFKDGGWVESEEIATPEASDVCKIAKIDAYYEYDLPDSDDEISVAIGHNDSLLNNKELIQIDYNSSQSQYIIIFSPVFTYTDKNNNVIRGKAIAKRTQGPMAAYMIVQEEDGEAYKKGDIIVYRIKNTYGSSMRVKGKISTADSSKLYTIENAIFKNS